MPNARMLVVTAAVMMLLGTLVGPAVGQEPADGDAATRPGVAQQLDAWFGEYISDPLWNYFIAFPLFQSDAVVVYEGAEADARQVARQLNDGEIVTWVQPLAGEGGYGVAVPASQRDTAIDVLKLHEVVPVIDGSRSRQGGVPFIVLVLLAGGVFFTLRFGFVNMRMFGHGVACILGRYDNPKDRGEITHFQALSSALSATLGLGNIAGVAIAITLGGPGAVFWMWLSGFLGMSMKFCESTLSQLYRRFDRDGHVLGGPMVVIDDGLGARGGVWRVGAKVMAVAYAIFVICAAFGVALFQTKASFGITQAVVPVVEGRAVAWGFGIAMAVLVAIVIIGGIARIGRVASKLVPAMCLFYVSVCLVLVLANITRVPELVGRIFAEAFTGPAIYGGFAGVLITGMRRGLFSNEAGIGSAAIAHAAARTEEPVREGLVAMLGPFLDTIVLCTMTALAILTTTTPGGANSESLDGAVLMADAFETLHWSMSYLLVIAVLVFAYSTMISWSYYGDRGTEYLLGRWAVRPFRVLFVMLVLIGPLLGISNILTFADITFFAAAFPNIIAMVLLSGVVMKLLKDYRNRLDTGAIQPVAVNSEAVGRAPSLDARTDRPAQRT